MTKHNIAFLGLGTMGKYMAVNLAHAGHEVSGWNRSPKSDGSKLAQQAGCRVTNTISDAVADADYIFICVSDDQAVEDVLFNTGGVAECAKPGSLMVDCSTITPQTAINNARKLVKYAIRYLEAPVSGGDVGARDATLTIMAAGSHDDFQNSRQLLHSIGRHIFYCGHAGAGQSIKLANQVLCALHAVAFAEAITLARRMGVDPQMVVEICSTGAGDSWALQNLAPRAITGDYAGGFAVYLMQKDLKLIKKAVGSLPGVDLADEIFKMTARLIDPSKSGTQAILRAYENEQPLAHNE